MPDYVSTPRNLIQDVVPRVVVRRQPAPEPQNVSPTSQAAETLVAAPAVVTQAKTKPTRIKLSGRHAGLALASVMLLVGVAILAQTLLTNKKLEQTLTKNDSQASSSVGVSDVPDEQPVSAQAKAAYVVAPDLPRLISVDKLGINGRVLRAGIKADGSLETPRNIYDAGWYESSSKPGQAGATFIVGHLTGAKNFGLFSNLDKLAVGDVVKLERGDGKLFSYKVIKKTIFEADKVDMASTLVSITSGKPGLNIMTCAGDLIESTNTFTKRLVVYTEQI